MRILRAWVVRFAALLAPRRRDDEFRQEIESHLQLHIDDNIRSGMSPAEARRDALLRLGGVEAVREAQRDRTGIPVLQHLAQDIRYASRVLRRNFTFTAVTIVTLALGIGANASIFTFVNAVLLRPLPYDDAERLVLIWTTDTRNGGREVSVSYPDFVSWRDETRAFDQVAALTSRSVTLGGGELAELVPAIQTTPRFFSVLGVRPVAGRVFTDADAAADAAPAAVISDSAWKRQFGGRDVIGATITVNQRPHVVIGVVPSVMHFIPTEVEQVYTLLPPETNREHGYLRVIARLRPGAALESAQAELDVLAKRTAAEFPGTNADAGASAVSLEAAVGAPVRDGLLILLALVGAILLIACTNVANLMLARNASRQHELALRMSLGAGRARIVQQLLTESLLLAFAGGAAGLALAPVLNGALVAMLAGGMPLPRIEDIGVDATVVFFTFALSAATGLLFGVVPSATRRRVAAGAPRAMQAARSWAVEADGGRERRSSSSRPRSRWSFSRRAPCWRARSSNSEPPRLVLSPGKCSPSGCACPRRSRRALRARRSSRNCVRVSSRCHRSVRPASSPACRWPAAATRCSSVSAISPVRNRSRRTSMLRPLGTFGRWGSRYTTGASSPRPTPRRRNRWSWSTTPPRGGTGRATVRSDGRSRSAAAR